MQLDQYFELGYIVKSHGTRGEVQVFFDVDDPGEYLEMESVLVSLGSELVPFFVEYIKTSGKSIVMKFDGVNSIEEASELKSGKLYLPLDLLPKLDEGQFYYHDIISYQVVDNNEGPLGVVKEVVIKGNQDLLIMLYKDVEILIPIVDDVVLKADHDSQTLSVNLPDGLLDIYLS